MDREGFQQAERNLLAEALENYQPPERDFLRFVREAWPWAFPYPYVHGRHVEVLAQHLQAVGEGKIEQLLANIPPGCSKSGVVSVLFPAWIWTREPSAEFLCLSYHESLTLRDAVRCRQLIGSPWYRARWGRTVRVKAGQDAKGLYELTAGGKRVSTTRGGLGTGFHPSHVIVDDPLSALQAQRKAERQAFDEWRSDTLATRGVARNVRQVFAFQRLHVDDPARAILEENQRAAENGEELPWYHVCLPMRFDPQFVMQDRGFGGDWRTEKGELLYPALLDEAKVRKMERALRSDSNVSAQLGQNPIRRQGRLFNVDHLKVIRSTEVPQLDDVVRFWDKAGVEDEGCATAGGLMGVQRISDEVWKFFILHMHKGQWGLDRVEDEISSTCAMDQMTYGLGRYRVGVEQEPGSGGKLSGWTTQKRLRGIRVEVLPAIGDKPTRATPLADAIALGEVYAVDGPWLRDMVEEMNEFPNSQFKDQVDALAGAYLMLTGAIGKKTVKTVLASGRTGSRKCASPGCGRPTAESSDYCCENCRLVASFDDGTVCSDHDHACMARFFEFTNRS
jgi:predicted phage terminase large subunit-like protein